MIGIEPIGRPGGRPAADALAPCGVAPVDSRAGYPVNWFLVNGAPRRLTSTKQRFPRGVLKTLAYRPHPSHAQLPKGHAHTLKMTELRQDISRHRSLALGGPPSRPPLMPKCPSEKEPHPSHEEPTMCGTTYSSSLRAKVANSCAKGLPAVRDSSA